MLLMLDLIVKLENVDKEIMDEFSTFLTIRRHYSTMEELALLLAAIVTMYDWCHIIAIE